MLPLVLLLVFNDKVVTHDNQVTVMLGVLKSYAQDVTESIKTGTSLALSIVSFDSRIAVEEFQEVHSLENGANSLLFISFDIFVVTHVSPLQDAFNEQAVVLGHTLSQIAAKLFDVSRERRAINLGESPEAELFQVSNSVTNWVIRCQTNIMEARNDGAKSLEPVCAADERVTVLHAEALHKDSAISVWVSFELHSHGDIVTLHCFL